MYQRKWKDTKCFLPPDHDPVFNADMIVRKPTPCNYYPQMDLEKSTPYHMGHICITIWHQIQNAACSLKSGISLLGHCT